MSQSNYKNRNNPRNQDRNQNKANKKSKLNLYSDYLERFELQQSNNHNYCVVPITLRHLSDLVDGMFRTFESMGRSYQENIYTEVNKRIYKKVCFSLAETKLDSGNNMYRSRNADHLCICEDFFHYLTQLRVPYPLALYLNSIGHFKNKSINYVPVPAITENHIADACYSCMPYKFINVLNQLVNGVEIEKVPVTPQESLKSLPAIEWEKIKNNEGVETHIRLAPESVEFWLKPRSDDATEDQARELNISHDDHSTFTTINDSLIFYPGILIDLKGNGEGNASQLVRYEKYKHNSNNNSEWYTMHGVPDDCKKLGIVFGFGHFEETVQASIAIGNSSTAHTRGYTFITEFMRALLQPIRDIRMQYDNSSDSE